MLVPFVAWSIWFMSTMPTHVVMCKKQNDMDPSGIGYQMDQHFSGWMDMPLYSEPKIWSVLSSCNLHFRVGPRAKKGRRKLAGTSNLCWNMLDLPV
jgi:hypothetical protein